MSEEATRVEEVKEGVEVVGTKSWNRTYKACGELYDKVKDIKVTKPSGKLIGKVAATLVKPITSFVGGVKEGWKE
jgi:hypothetical protein